MNRRPAFLLTCLLLLPSAAFAITSGQVDNFENGTTMSWREGPFSPNGPQNITTGGPAGVNDNYLRNVSSGQAFTAGGKMIMFNTAQWTGNYVAAGVTSIQISMANFGETPLAMRIALEGNTSEWGSVNAFALPADGQWYTHTFGLGAGELSLIAGASSLNDALAAVTTLRILSRGDGPGWNGDEVAGILGVDNITASATSGVGDRPSIVTSLAHAPNPFRSSTTIRYELSEASPVTIEIFDLAGRSVRLLESATFRNAGDHEIAWDGRSDAGASIQSGVYFYRLTSSSAVLTRKMMLIRE
jgi:hypothetical protein